jgi:Mce-associated membrane protein
VVRADTDTATVLVAVDRTVKDSTDPQGAVAHDRWRVDLEKHGGRWLVSDLEPVA